MPYSGSLPSVRAGLGTYHDTAIADRAGAKHTADGAATETFSIQGDPGALTAAELQTARHGALGHETEILARNSSDDHDQIIVKNVSQRERGPSQLRRPA